MGLASSGNDVASTIDAEGKATSSGFDKLSLNCDISFTLPRSTRLEQFFLRKCLSFSASSVRYLVLMPLALYQSVGVALSASPAPALH